MTYSKNYIDLVEEAMLTLGESAPDSVDKILELPKMKLFTGALKAYEGSGGERIFRATASSTIKDLHGDYMTEDCVRDMARQAKHGPVGKGLTIFLNHQYRVPEDVAGKVADTQVLNRANGDDGLPIWDMDYGIKLRSEGPGSERVDSTWSLIHIDEITLGISIGAYILEYDFIDKDAGFWGGLIINKVLLVETSIVGIPANQRSWVQNAIIAIGKSLGLEERQIRKVLDGKETAPMTTKADEIVEDKLPDEPGPINSPEEQTAEPKVTDGDKASTTDTTDSEAAEKVEESGAIAEAAPVPESTAEQTTSEEPTTDGETTASADLAAEVSELMLAVSASGDQPIDLLTAALEHAAAMLSANRARTKELEAENSTLKEQAAKQDQDLKAAADLIEVIAKSPLGRKTQFRQPVESFVSRYGAIYDEGFLKLIED